MNLIRRRFLSIAGATITGLAASPLVCAQAYPARSVRVIVPFAPGGATDIIARLILQELSKQLGQQFYVENLARCERQHRHRTSCQSSTRRLHRSLRIQLPCHESFYVRQAPLRSRQGFRAGHACGHVPCSAHHQSFRPGEDDGGPCRTDQSQPRQIQLRLGRNGNPATPRWRTAAPVAWARSRACAPQWRRPCARLGAWRTCTDELYHSVASSPSHQGWHVARACSDKQDALADGAGRAHDDGSGIPRHRRRHLGRSSGAHTGTDPHIITLLNREIVKIVNLAAMKERLVQLGYEPVGTTPDEYGVQIRTEIAKWAKVIRSAGIRVQ